METPDRTGGVPPSWTPAPLQPSLPPRPAAWDDRADAPTGPAISPRLAWRALRRHWWQILALWAVASAGLVALAYTKIKPTYESTAWLKVDPGTRALLGQASHGADLGVSMETQVRLLTSPDVLNAALKDPKVMAQPMVRQSLDPEVELRDQVRAAIVPKTQLIMVSMSSESPAEPAVIVNAIVKAFLDQSKLWLDHETSEQLTQLKDLRDGFHAKRVTQRDMLQNLQEQSAAPDRVGEAGQVSLEQYQDQLAQLSQLELERIAAESHLRVVTEAYQVRSRGPRSATAGRGGEAAGPQGAALEKAVEEAFLADPSVQQLLADKRAAERHLGDLKRIAARNSDPSVIRAQRRYDDLQADYKKQWEQSRVALRARIARGERPESAQAAPAEDPMAEEYRRARMEVQELQIREERLRDRLKTLEVEDRGKKGENLELQFAKADLAYTDQMIEAISKNVDQLEYEANNTASRVNLISAAKPTFKPQSNKRTMMMAAAPVAALAAIVGLFLLLELRSGRVADPDDLAARARLDVIGVVPPLPGQLPARRSPRALRDERRRVEEFVQSLDHLRVTLCSGPEGVHARRCLLITSAVGGEGKTTLAAQLAGRCANAGLMTLLIDADLRRPSLGDLLEVPEGPGLADVLLGEADPEAAMVVIGSAGGFHLLPAGTPGHDPARLLHGERVHGLIAQLRATFDVVIIDAPPVLAVPDALLLGRWTDGAVLAVRHDASRFPLVERAHRRLASVGVPVLGAVVNGVRTMESGYGLYHYTSAGRDDEPA